MEILSRLLLGEVLQDKSEKEKKLAPTKVK
jgi:hypothetical protein